MEPFVHLHVHTEYSLLDGANRIPDLVRAAVEDEHDSLAITDHGNLYGSLEFYKECRKAGIKPILGCEVYVAMKSMREKHSRQENPYTHLTLLARDAEGWRNLHQLSSAAHLEGLHFRPRVDLDFIAGKTAGITCLSGCMSGPVNRRLMREDEAGAMEMAGRLQDMFGKDNFHLEIMRNGMKAQDKLTEGMVRMREKVGAPLVATNDIHYLRHEDCNAQDALICIHTGAKKADENRWKMETDTLFFRTREEMNAIFSDLPEALSNTLEISRQIDVEIDLGKQRLPRFDPEDGSTPEEFFRKICEEGFARFYPGNPGPARERMEQEIGVITQMGFLAYFLIVWDLVRYARENNIPVGPGRGSAAGSLVAFVMGITRIDPLEHDLIFERFLNASRISMPDIDIDFCKDRREEMLHYIRRRYGDENVCQIITFGKMKARAALRDVARVLDIPLKEVDEVAKKVPEGPGVTLSEAMAQDPELAAVADISDLHKEWFDLAINLEGLARHSSVHAAGIIIADEPLREIIPLAKQDEVITSQWDMKGCEEFGLLKMDILGVRTLTILQHATELAATRSGTEIDLDALPLDDPDTYALLQKADTEGIFQLESNGMRRLLSDLQPTGFEDIVAVLALHRPGPLGSRLHERYIERKHGREKVEVHHPLLEDLLRETFGVLLYQEQIMRVAQNMGGFRLEDADSLRKAMGKKDASLMEGFEEQFLEGAEKKDVPTDTAKEIWDMMKKFAEYGFNKSHSAGYAMVTFQAAWLKAHFPDEFYAASFTHEAQDTDKLRILIEDARHHGIRVLPPCVNQSTAQFKILENNTIRYGFAAVKGVGSGAAEAMVELREKREEGGFPRIQDVYVDGVAHHLNKSTFESLVKAGAFDTFGVARVNVLDSLEEDLRVAQASAEDRRRGQGSLFADPEPSSTNGLLPSSDNPGDAHRAPRRLTDEERIRTLRAEKEALGLYLTRHPLDPYREILGGVSSWDSRNLADAGDGTQVCLAGIASGVTVRPTRKDPSRKVGNFRIEDLWGSSDALAWPSTLEEMEGTLEEDFIGLFHGKLGLSRDQPQLLVERIEPLPKPEEIALKGSLEIRLPDPAPLGKLKDILGRHPGRASVRFIYIDPEGRQRIRKADSDWGVELGTGVLTDLQDLLGPGRVMVVSGT